MRIVIGMATTEDRYEYAKKACDSLQKQTGVSEHDIKIHLCLNSDERDKADNGKFEYLERTFKQPDKYPFPDVFLSVDDDIIYPRKYVKNILKALEEHECIVTYHGRKLVGKGKNFYHDHVAFSCLRDMDGTVRIDVAGTGVTAFKTNYFLPSEISEDKRLYMSDLLFSLEAAKQKKKIMCLEHSKSYFKYQNIPEEMTIYYNQHMNCEVQNGIADEIYTLNYEKVH